MTEKLIDTHFHLDYYRNHSEIYESINRLKQYTLCVTNSPGVFVSCRNLYQETKYVKFAIGFHPQKRNLSIKDFNDFLKLLDRTNYVGEIGLDFSSGTFLPKKLQLDYFDLIVNTCARKNKLMSVHLRKAEDEAIEIINRYRPQKCIIHWFTGTSTHLDMLIELGCYFSINANMVRNKTTSSKLIKIPQSKILVESDGPFTKVEGKKYIPELLLPTYTTIARYYQNPNFLNQVYLNFKNLLMK